MNNYWKEIEDYLIAAFEKADVQHKGGDINAVKVKRGIADALAPFSPQKSHELRNRVMHFGTASPSVAPQSEGGSISGFGTKPPSTKSTITLKKKGAQRAKLNQPSAPKPVEENTSNTPPPTTTGTDDAIISESDLEKIRKAQDQGTITTTDAGTAEAIASLTVQKIASQYKDSIDGLLAHFKPEVDELPTNIMQKAALLKKTVVAHLESK